MRSLAAAEPLRKLSALLSKMSPLGPRRHQRSRTPARCVSAGCALAQLVASRFDHEDRNGVTFRALIEPGVDDPECSIPAERDRVAKSPVRYGGVERRWVGGLSRVLSLEDLGDRGSKGPAARRTTGEGLPE
jgi:hypothetical protein